MKAKHTTHIYTEWRLSLDDQQRVRLARLEQRVQQTAAPVLTDDQVLVVLLARILDDGGETLEYIRPLADAE